MNGYQEYVAEHIGAEKEVQIVIFKSSPDRDIWEDARNAMQFAYGHRNVTAWHEAK